LVPLIVDEDDLMRDYVAYISPSSSGLIDWAVEKQNLADAQRTDAGERQ